MIKKTWQASHTLSLLLLILIAGGRLDSIVRLAVVLIRIIRVIRGGAIADTVVI